MTAEKPKVAKTKMPIFQKIYHNIAFACFQFWELLALRVTPKQKPKRGARRGVALLLVLTYIAVMSATILSSFMNSQVSYSIAANIRDDLKAYYKARTALNLGRLMLTYQYELEADDFFGERIRRSNFQIYQILDLLMTPFKTGIVTVGAPGAEAIASYNLREAGVDAMGDESGDYNVHVFPEAGRVNLNRFAGGAKQDTVYELCMLFASPEYDEIFNTRGRDRNKLTRSETVAAIIDWVDSDSERTNLTNDCVLEEPSGDESSLYSETRRKFDVKNAKLTTLDELYEVAGIGDDFMNAFSETLTVYPVEKVNVNLANAKVLYSALCSSASLDGMDPKDDRLWACREPIIGDKLMILAMAIEGYQQFVLNPMNLLYLYTVEKQTSVIPGVVPNGTIVPFRSRYEFTNVLDAMKTDPLLIKKFVMYSPTAYIMLGQNLMQLPVEAMSLSGLSFDSKRLNDKITTDNPRVFRVVAVGEYGGTRKTLSAVVDFNEVGGKFLYWREY